MTFQFLMVRLKVVVKNDKGKVVPTFQFLMVRLKGRGKCGSFNNRIISIPYGSIKRQ